MKRPLLRALRFTLRWVGIGLLLAVVVVIAEGWAAFGKRAEGPRRLRMERSANFRDGHFVNPQPLYNDYWGMFSAMWQGGSHVTPDEPPPARRLDRAQLERPPESGLRISWFGHSSTLIELDGKRVLTDPMWSDRASPISWLGPSRWYPTSISLEAFPKLDAVVISHDHYDHLDYESVRRLNQLGVKFVVPLGVGAHLEYWGVPLERIVELDWWERVSFGNFSIVCTPARHASGRFLLDKDATLWSGWALLGPKHRVYYSGDTGLFPDMKRIGAELGPFDVTLIEVGQYNRAWPDWHIGPEQAVKAHAWVRGKVMLPVHWGLLGLAFHSWTEPVERSLVAAKAEQVELVTPPPGDPIQPSEHPNITRWWPEVPWQTAAEHPIVSTQIEQVAR